MQTKTIVIAGCGDVGSAIGQLLNKAGHKVIGLRRNINQLPQGIQGISADLTQLDALKQSLKQIEQCDILVYAASASTSTEEGYRSAYVDGLKNTLAALPMTPSHLFFTSSTGVYHQNDHSWVDEESPCEPKRFSGQVMLEAEQLLHAQSIPATAVRFSGIYGPGRGYLINKVREGNLAPESPLQYSNRIHRDDCAGVVAHLINRVFEGLPVDKCYLASDDHPCSMHEITHWLAGELKASMQSESVTRFSGSKRCSNKRLKESGYQFIYPDFKTGYKTLIN